MSEIMKNGAITVTVVDPDPGFEDWPNQGLLTVRGKDHDMTIDEFEQLAEICSNAAAILRARERNA